MKVLAIDFSSPQRSVAVVQDQGGTVSENETVETGGATTGAFGMAEKVLRAAGIEREQIDVLAVGIGPGSYTGIRAAIAIAQGWYLATGIKLAAIGAVPCLVEQARAEGWQGMVSFVMDAQRHEFYVATWELGEEAREIEPLRLLTMQETRQRQERGDLIAGPEVARWFPEGRLLIPRASIVGKLVLRRPQFVPGERIEPIYLREVAFVKAPPPRTSFGESGPASTGESEKGNSKTVTKQKPE